MGFLHAQRHRLVVRLARAQLGPGGEVLAWTRARHPRRRLGFQRLGFLYVTPNAVLIRWGGDEDEYNLIRWREIESWGLNRDADGGPILAIKTDDGTHYAQIPSMSESSASEATTLLRAFAERVPKGPGRFDFENHYGRFEGADRNVHVSRSRRGVFGHTKRVSVTVIGLLLLIGGVILLVLPGPGILLIILGLAVLGSEYDIASDAMHWIMDHYQETLRKIKERRKAKKGA
ncbi:MAG TPA: PGPGW domain-containing protein [Actinomycetota bacterium]|nr:PGPGW domain-containing protein [Actinomycetota bacterium]